MSMQDTHSLKQNNAILNERINMIIKRATSATEANKMLTSRLGSYIYISLAFLIYVGMKLRINNNFLLAGLYVFLLITIFILELGSIFLINSFFILSLYIVCELLITF